jgi:hypothetical protein
MRRSHSKPTSAPGSEAATRRLIDQMQRVKFNNGMVDWRIVLTADGKVAGVGIRKMP